MSKNIVDGKLVEMSPSMIVQFDASTSFGCEQRGVFKYVMGLEDPPTGNQQLGTDLHSLAEERLLTGKTPSGEGEAFGLYLAGQAMIEQVAARKILKVEQPIPTFYISGVKVKGYNDVVTSDGIVDWKTSSDIRRYGKTAADLAKDTAMVIYGKAEHPTLPSVKLAHGQFQTKGRKSTDFVEVEVSQEHLDAHIEKVIVPLVERMKELAAFPDRAVRDFKKCFNCTFRPRCPTPGAETVMGFFTKVINKETASVSAGSLLNDGSFAVKPPDAPESKPELAADPIPGFDPLPPKKLTMKIVDEPTLKDAVVEAMAKSPAAFAGESQTDRDARAAMEYSQKLKEEAERAKAKSDNLLPVQEQTLQAHLEKEQAETKRKPGRPPGAKNKAKDEPKNALDTALENEAAGAPLMTAENYKKVVATGDIARQFESVTVNMGVTVNVGNFNSVRFDVSITSREHTYEEVYAEVKRRLDGEAAKYEAEISKGNVVNAKGLVSK